MLCKLKLSSIPKILTLLFCLSTLTPLISGTHLRMKARHPLFRPRVIEKPSLFQHLYDKRPVSGFRFVETMISTRAGSPETEGTNAKMVESPVKKKGWVKFIVMNPEQPKKFSNFYYNEAFDNQNKYPELKDPPKDEFGPIDIPDNTHFFAVASTDALYILSGRRNDISKTQAVIPYSSLYPQEPANSKFLGGVEDIGNFKEGFCFKLKQRSSGTIEWIVCADTPDEKGQWLGILANLRLKAQGGKKGDGGGKGNGGGGAAGKKGLGMEQLMNQEVELSGAFGEIANDKKDKKNIPELSPDPSKNEKGTEEDKKSF